MSRRSVGYVYRCSRCPAVLCVSRRDALSGADYLARRGWRRAEPGPSWTFAPWVCGECWKKDKGKASE